MQITLDPVRPAARETLYRLLQFSLYELSGGDGREMDGEAVFPYQWFDRYFDAPDELERYAWFIRAADSGRLLGFVMVNSYMQRSPAGHSIAEFLIIPKYRRMGAGTAAARACFDRFPGPWEVSPAQGSERARRFWQTVIADYTGRTPCLEDGLFCFSAGGAGP